MDARSKRALLPELLGLFSLRQVGSGRSLVEMFTFYAVHVCLLVWGAYDAYHYKTVSPGSIGINPFGFLLLGATFLSLLRINWGRRLIRFVAIIGMMNFWWPLFSGTILWARLIDLLIWCGIYWFFRPKGPWVWLYSPWGHLGKAAPGNSLHV
jgi:hypothetical protein